jgi:hypothetical protein
MSQEITLVLGDVLRIERRYLVDGVVTKVTDEGRFAGVQSVGTSEHLVLEDDAKAEVRLFPLTAISEITLVQALPRQAKPAAGPAPGAWDPGVA